MLRNDLVWLDWRWFNRVSMGVLISLTNWEHSNVSSISIASLSEGHRGGQPNSLKYSSNFDISLEILDFFWLYSFWKGYFPSLTFFRTVNLHLKFTNLYLAHFIMRSKLIIFKNLLSKISYTNPNIGVCFEKISLLRKVCRNSDILYKMTHLSKNTCILAR